ncbi:MAG: GNAT family protein [Prosthecobacter sp.]
MSDHPPTFLEGRTVRLRPLRESDAEGPYPTWLNSMEVTAYNSHGVHPYTVASARAFIESATTREDRVILAIEDKASGRHIGNVSLQSIHPVFRSAELAILVGDVGIYGKGAGTESCRLIIEHGFSRLNLHRIHCGTFATNTGMIRIAHKLGMKEEGRRREAAYKNGDYVDVIEFGLLRSEYMAQSK